jgi:peptidoglycan/xylan/chitin deacetylase (PgdA/CDA1 family)
MDVPASLLKRQLELLLSAGWSLLGQTQALEQHRLRPDSKNIGVTFDDAYSDAANAAQIVLELGGTCTIYAPTALVGTAGHLDWTSLRELKAQGVELGSHSHSHRAMDVLPEADLIRELVDSKETLRSETDATAASFCYPHGYTSRRVRKLAARAGYHNACIVGRRIAKPGDPLLALPRLQPTGAMSDQDFLRLVDRGEPGLGPLAKRLLAPGWRVARSTSMKFGVELT